MSLSDPQKSMTNLEITDKLRKALSNKWKKLTSGYAYQVPETKEDFKSLGGFPYFQIGNVLVYPKGHTFDHIHSFNSLIHDIVGEDNFSLNTVYGAVRNEIMSFYENGGKGPFEQHLAHLLKAILSTMQKRRFIRSVLGFNRKDFPEIVIDKWQLKVLNDEDIDIILEQEKHEDWRPTIKKHLTKQFKDNVCLIIETEGDAETAQMKANKIAIYIINTMRYFICIHASQSSLSHYFGVWLDDKNLPSTLNSLRIDLEDRSSAILSFGGSTRQKYCFKQESLCAIKKYWNADDLWSLIDEEERTDLEESIISGVSWIGDAHQDDNINTSFVKYWIAIEALLIGHNKDDVSKRIKSTIPVIVSRFEDEVPSKTRVEKLYDLRSKVVHCGFKHGVNLLDLSDACSWATKSLATCIALRKIGYENRNQIEKEVDRLSNMMNRR